MSREAGADQTVLQKFTFKVFINSYKTLEEEVELEKMKTLQASSKYRERKITKEAGKSQWMAVLHKGTKNIGQYGERTLLMRFAVHKLSR